MTSVASTDVDAFSSYLSSSSRILVLVGAGLSASSGIRTYRGPGKLWQEYDVKKIATPWAFEEDPLKVWSFYAERKHDALRAQPNPAHYALAQLATEKNTLLMINQNVDGLCERAGHPLGQLHRLHGWLFALQCLTCDYSESENIDDYVELAEATDDGTLAPVLPRCPNCASRYLRPGVVWYGEQLPAATLQAIDEWCTAGPIDLMLIVGTSSSGYGPAELIDYARRQGAPIAVVNANCDDPTAGGLDEDDWFFAGDAATIVPEILRGVIGSNISPA